MICLAIAFLVLGWCWLRFVTRLSERTVHDVYPFFRRINRETLYGSFHPGSEHNFRSTHTREEFRKWQWKRIHLAIHLCRDITANCELLMSWAAYERNTNWRSFPDELRRGLREFQVACLHSRTASFAVRCRLRFWLVRIRMFPFLPMPSFNKISSHGDTLYAFYKTAEAMAEVISLTHGEEIHRNMLEVLGMVNLAS